MSNSLSINLNVLNTFKSLNFKSMLKKRNFTVYDMRNILSREKMKKEKIKFFGVGR